MIFFWLRPCLGLTIERERFVDRSNRVGPKVNPKESSSIMSQSDEVSVLL